MQDRPPKLSRFIADEFVMAYAPRTVSTARVTPAKRGRGGKRLSPNDADEPTPVERRASMIRTQRLKRVFNIDIDKSAGQPICTAEGCREAVGYREVIDEPAMPVTARSELSPPLKIPW